MDRIIFLVDMNAFFISCEMTRHPALRNKPAAVAGDPSRRTGIILAASYEARAFGVRTTMLVHQAQRLCPNLSLVPPDHAFYEQKSAEVMALLARYAPVLEQNSIDEAWLDMTGCQTLFGTPLETARMIMKAINDELSLWCSIGISSNKFLAKMASEMHKPHGITELWPADLAEKLWPLPAGAMYGVGQKTAARLASLGLRTIGDLARVKEDVLVDLLGKFGREISRHARGIDPEPVIPHAEDSVKSIGRSTTLVKDLTNLEEARKVLLELADDVGRSARKHDKMGRTVHIVLKYSDFSVITRQMTVVATYATSEIYQAGSRLLEQNWYPDKPVRLIGISLSGFENEAADRQLSLFDQPEATQTVDRQVRVDQAMDLIRNRFGEKSVTRAKQLKVKGER
ncbi:MAG TPA: DNA polymerase IV [Clostridiales bacterium]|nr:DNA polymerase IV [Clostridiales bacterium]